MRAKKPKKTAKNTGVKKKAGITHTPPAGSGKLSFTKSNSSDVYKKLLITSSDAITITDLDGTIRILCDGKGENVTVEKTAGHFH